jgi:hypothetical protein
MAIEDTLIGGGIGLLSGIVITVIGTRHQRKLQDREFEHREEERVAERHRQAEEDFKLALDRLVNAIVKYQVDPDAEKWESLDNQLGEVSDAWLTFPDSYKEGDVLREFAILDRMSFLAKQAKKTLSDDQMIFFWSVFQEVRWAAHSLRDSLSYSGEEQDNDT